MMRACYTGEYVGMDVGVSIGPWDCVVEATAWHSSGRAGAGLRELAAEHVTCLCIGPSYVIAICRWTGVVWVPGFVSRVAHC